MLTIMIMTSNEYCTICKKNIVEQIQLYESLHMIYILNKTTESFMAT